MIVYCEGNSYDTDQMERLLEVIDEPNGVTLLSAWKTDGGQMLVVVTNSILPSGRDDEIVGVEGHFASEEKIVSLISYLRLFGWRLRSDEGEST